MLAGLKRRVLRALEYARGAWWSAAAAAGHTAVSSAEEDGDDGGRGVSEKKGERVERAPVRIVVA